MLCGFLNVNKESGASSTSVVGAVKRLLRESGDASKVGHFGTLDQLASGVLPIGLGRANRLFEYSLEKTKTYRAEFLFGADSPSLDSGTEMTRSDFAMPDRLELERAFAAQRGEIMQEPPAYSAKKVGGARAYRLVRQGAEFSLRPKKVVIHSVDIVEIRGNSVSVDISCGGGTYVRAIGRDAAKALGTTAVMTKLVRTSSGIFALEDSLPIEEIVESYSSLVDRVLPADAFLADFERTDVDFAELRALRSGRAVERERPKDGFVAVYCNDCLAGIGTYGENGALSVRTWLA